MMPTNDDVERRVNSLTHIQLSDADKSEIWSKLDERMTQAAPAQRRRWGRAWLTGLSGVAAVIVAAGGVWYSTSHTGTSVAKTPNPGITGTVTRHSNAVGHWAILDVQPNSTYGAPLYAVTETKDDAARTTLIEDHVLWARLSSNGDWLAVQVSGSRSTTANVSTLWLMSSDGKQKMRVPADDFRAGDWVPGTDEFVYTTQHSRQLFVVQPNQAPKPYALDLPENAEITSIRFSPDSRYLAVLVSVNPPGGGNVPDTWHDEILVRDLRSGQQTTLVKAKAPDGLVLGPWATGSQSLFYWDDPAHSASLLMDGAKLSQVNLSGDVREVATALTQSLGQKTIAPYGQDSAAVQVGSGRQLYSNKQVKLFENGQLLDIPGSSPSQVELSPDATSDGSMVVFTSAPVLRQPVTNETGYQNWIHQMTLDVYSKAANQTTVITAAGTGIQAPFFTADGLHITYLQGTSVWSIATSPGGTPKKLSELPPGTLQVADYRP